MTTLVETAMSPLQPTLPQITVLGIGNLLWADEGFGVRCVEALQQRYEFADNVALIDGGTQGLYLIQHVQQADYLLIFDAVDYNLAPGELKFIADDEVPKFLGIKNSACTRPAFRKC
jgi:hydrogenase maturation protease